MKQIEVNYSKAIGRIAQLEAEITDCLKVCQNYVTDFQALQMENERLREAVKNALKTPWVEPMSVIARQLLADALKKEGGKASE